MAMETRYSKQATWGNCPNAWRASLKCLPDYAVGAEPSKRPQAAQSLAMNIINQSHKASQI